MRGRVVVVEVRVGIRVAIGLDRGCAKVKSRWAARLWVEKKGQASGVVYLGGG